MQFHCLICNFDDSQNYFLARAHTAITCKSYANLHAKLMASFDMFYSLNNWDQNQTWEKHADTIIILINIFKISAPCSFMII
jgi:hypothetical protein